MGDEKRVLTMKTINPRAVEMEYAVRGPIVTRSVELLKELAAGAQKPFSKVLPANIGDCHATGQTPITFIRQVVALCTLPDLLNSDSFPDDTKQRARRILQGCKGQSTGSYSASPGIDVIRQDIADYITKRDGHPSRPEDIILSTGASDAIKTVLNLLMTGDSGNNRAGIMIPVPQYPLYSATLTEFNACPIPYYLNEENKWSLDVSELKRAIDEAKGKCKPRAICVINPGNPTGQVLSRKNIEDIIKFAYEEKLMVLSDEVYQHNVYAAGSEFFSFKKVMTEMGAPYCNMELASFMSASKGYMGECGFRGGYAEIVNLQADVKAILLKSISAKLCPPILGQVVIDTIVNPPQPGEPSYEKFKKEKQEVLSLLKKKAVLVTELFNSIEGITCNEVMGAMYAFPRLHLPEKAVEAAKQKNQSPDFFYCFQLLEETGLCVVPGSGFGEKPGTYHFRITILPPLEEMRAVLEQFKLFHMKFLQKYK
ncbi:alanine aminotransferase 2-like [Mya arenaria]|uniref:alanine aminotransferase 2-like n=1 Tax=Mya arenaria TaxID=6604 RepID=UPI0022E4BE02|nr:alanine aminotransferase 2-like [Mya arenaria]XP_052780450.1 alanine aminotransferase 2-like [Mya arenaria]XP_052780451.1 alanine aminotransferase 2-like [Mya arenaria]XP_052780453.1 alanine aminotransferase 2-like [Mya arenaria]XP_052780454.1 alanine aminotransferase 2-like [Mya arenaria]XP_052780455.1 alanine aminotransferase 2-like [Mya arenaria]